jgi:hypothetical protein
MGKIRHTKSKKEVEIIPDEIEEGEEVWNFIEFSF